MAFRLFIACELPPAITEDHMQHILPGQSVKYAVCKHKILYELQFLLKKINKGLELLMGIYLIMQKNHLIRLFKKISCNCNDNSDVIFTVIISD